MGANPIANKNLNFFEHFTGIRRSKMEYASQKSFFAYFIFERLILALKVL